MNVMIKVEVEAGIVKGIKLPMEDRQQVIAQYADDMSLIFLGEEEPIRRLISTLETFCASSGLILNWNKSCGYWKAPDRGPRPNWIETLGITWAANDTVNKLLGTAFGLSITTEDANTFLVERINKALEYWSTKKVNSTG
jgi:hypothetical protein